MNGIASNRPSPSKVANISSCVLTSTQSPERKLEAWLASGSLSCISVIPLSASAGLSVCLSVYYVTIQAKHRDVLMPPRKERLRLCQGLSTPVSRGWVRRSLSNRHRMPTPNGMRAIVDVRSSRGTGRLSQIAGRVACRYSIFPLLIKTDKSVNYLPTIEGFRIVLRGVGFDAAQTQN